MDVDEVASLYTYNRWANARTLASAAALSHEQFTRDLGSSFCSVRGTLVHILSAEWIWLQRWAGRSPTEHLTATTFKAVAEVRTRWNEMEAGQEAFLETLGPEELRRELVYRNFRGESRRYVLGEVLRHVVNHSTYHRGQVVTMLRQLGAVPQPTDWLAFLDLSLNGRPLSA